MCLTSPSSNHLARTRFTPRCLRGGRHPNGSAVYIMLRQALLKRPFTDHDDDIHPEHEACPSGSAIGVSWPSPFCCRRFCPALRRRHGPRPRSISWDGTVEVEVEVDGSSPTFTVTLKAGETKRYRLRLTKPLPRCADGVSSTGVVGQDSRQRRGAHRWVYPDTTPTQPTPTFPSSVGCRQSDGSSTRVTGNPVNVRAKGRSNVRANGEGSRSRHTRMWTRR